MFRREAIRDHANDPNFPSNVREKIEYFLSGDSSTLENYESLLDEVRIGQSRSDTAMRSVSN